MLALDISRRLEKNLLNFSALEALIQRLAVGSLGFRADRLKNYMGSVNKEENNKSVYKIIKSLAFNKNQKFKFNEFNKKLQKETFGIVLTAHPTFGMTHQIMINLARLATNKNEKGKPQLSPHSFRRNFATHNYNLKDKYGVKLYDAFDI